MKIQSEATFQKHVKDDLDKFKDCYYLKTQERGRHGVPDILICLRGKFIAIELKRDGKMPTKLQELKLEKIRRAGGIAFSASPSTWVGQRKMLEGV